MTYVTRKGADSAYGPTESVLAQLQFTYDFTFWAGYIGGLGAYRVWTQEEWDVLRQANKPSEPFGALPIWVPPLSLETDPTEDAYECMDNIRAKGMDGKACALDTEAVERGNPRLVSYVDTWCKRIKALEAEPIVYAGAGYVPSGVLGWFPRWGDSMPVVWVQAHGRTMVQTAPTTQTGFAYDEDYASPDFPFCSWQATSPETKKSAPPAVPVYTPKLGNTTLVTERYTVRYGDTLWGIAQKFYHNTSYWTEIARWNNIPVPNLLQEGTVLKLYNVPTVSTSPFHPNGHTVVVKPGDTLSSLALHYYGNAMDWPRIYNANRYAIGTNPNLLHVGTKLVIPA